VERLSDDELDALTALNLAELLRSGCTTQVEMSLSLRQAESYVRVAERWGVRVLKPPLWGQALINFVVLPLAGSVGLMAPWCERAFRWLVEPAKVFGGMWPWRAFWVF